MKEKSLIRKKWLTIRLNEKEEKKLLDYFQKSTSPALSEYARDVLLQKPVTILYRNASADAWLEEMILLKRELNAIGNNFNQAVHRLHTLDFASEVKDWALRNETSKNQFFSKVTEIQLKMNEIYELWLQK